MQVAVHSSINDIPPDDWDGLAGPDFPFLKHGFLAAAEQSGCVSAATGWMPRHLSIREGEKLRAAIVLYEKSHSWGEFVFDWAWANAYQRAGFDYYPKLVSTIPFTPARSPRLLLADRDDHAAASALVDGAIALAAERGCSSVHVLFPMDEELPALEKAGLKLRKDCQFHWHNRGYADFDEFLATFSSKKRKNARRDRRLVREAGIGFRRLHGADLDTKTWQRVYELISITFMRRGSLPYLDLEFFRRYAAEHPDDLLVIVAEDQTGIVAAAVFYRSGTALYGRYWGSEGRHDALHFETCYYQGIDYCIEHGLTVFEPGTQGEHKISRGFTPRSTWSAHWLAQPEFFSAISEYLDDEAKHVERYMEVVDEHSPYRKDGGRDAT